MNLLAVFLSVDPSLGRVDYDSFSDQTLMEMFIDGFDDETKKKVQDNERMYLDVRKWFCVSCDNFDRVVKVCASFHQIRGQLQISFLPPKVKQFQFPGRGVEGSADLTHLPQAIEYVNLHQNELTGSIDLTQLPRRIWLLFLDCNRLSGSVDLTQLPDSIKDLNLSNNQFSGSIDLKHLPEVTRELCLHGNQFSGSFIAKNLPPSPYCRIDANGNRFSAIAVVESGAKPAIDLYKSGVTSVVDENGNKRDKTWKVRI